MSASADNFENDPRVYVVRQTNQIRGLHTIIRNENCSREAFIFYSDRLIRLLIEEALSFLPFREKVVETPTGTKYVGMDHVNLFQANPCPAETRDMLLHDVATLYNELILFRRNRIYIEDMWCFHCARRRKHGDRTSSRLQSRANRKDFNPGELIYLYFL